MIDHPYFEKLGLKVDEKSFRECYVDLGTWNQTGDILNVRKDLKDWVEFRNVPNKYKSEEISNSAIIAYIVCMYDPKSPFRSLEYETRKKASALYAGFITRAGGEFSGRGQEILNCEEEIISIMIIRYCALVRGLEYNTYKEFERRYYEIILKDPSKKIVDIERDRQQLAAYRDMFLANDQSPELKRVFYTVVTEEEKKLRELRPEYQEQYFYNQIQMRREQIEDSYKDN